MPTPTMTALEFHRIQQELASFAACQLGKELALATRPLPSPDLVRRAQEETTEAKWLLTGSRSVPFGSIQDVRAQVDRAAQGGILRPEQLVAVADTIYGCRQLCAYLTQHKETAPRIARHADAFGQFDEAEDEIRRCIDRGTVSSRASRTLKDVRSEIAVMEGRIQDRLGGILKQLRPHLQEALITTRNGRYVLPVKAAARQAVPGIVHGASASGSTVFVEPEAIRQPCEELEYWRAAEQAEVEQVLATLSGLVAAHADGLQATLGAVAQLDLVFARARLSRAWDAQPVQWNEAGLVDLKAARHPLLGRSAVGNRIRMSPDRRMLIVTGPNTGGKTLLLKTLGLLVLVAQCGLHIPVQEGSTLCFFTDVFADIGDSQSLEQSLSTFSGHIANVAPMLGQAGPHTLILLDELGSGTDPHEGTGLGIALLEAFLQRGAYTLVTTHLREIKEFGRRTPGCAIAGMGFDGETLRPTYLLIYGTLGESHGLEIAARAGLPAEVVGRARRLVYGSEAPTSATTTLEFGEPAKPLVPDVPVSVPKPVPPETPLLVHAPAPAGHPAARADARRPVVVGTVSPRRSRIWDGESEAEVSVGDAVRRQYPGGLVPGDCVSVWRNQVTEVALRRGCLVSRDADTGAEATVAANLTRLLIILSARQPDFHATLLARHLFYAERQGIPPIICLTKGDLVLPEVASGWLKPFQALGYDTIVVSAVKKRGLDELKRLLVGQVTAVIGCPGAGKSTLLAALTESAGGLPSGAADGGRLRLLGPDSWLLDVPGLRALGVWKPDLTGGCPEFGPRVDQGRHRQYGELLQHLRMQGAPRT